MNSCSYSYSILRNELYSINNHFKEKLHNLNDYKKSNDKNIKGHFHDSYDIKYSILKSQIRDCISQAKRQNIYKDVINENIKRNIGLPDYIIKALQVIGVPNKDVNLVMIRKYYKIAVKANHPDKGGSVEKMQEINQAYKTLKDFYGRI